MSERKEIEEILELVEGCWQEGTSGPILRHYGELHRALLQIRGKCIKVLDKDE